MMNNSTMIRVRDLAARFGQRTIFEHVTFDVRRGEVFVILGGSGSGKSTLLKLMIGLYEPAAGSVEILGEDLAAAEGEARRALLRRIGVMWQSGALFGSLTLAENIEVPLEEHTALPAEARALVARAKLGLVGLADAAGRLPAEISPLGALLDAQAVHDLAARREAAAREGEQERLGAGR